MSTDLLTSLRQVLENVRAQRPSVIVVASEEPYLVLSAAHRVLASLAGDLPVAEVVTSFEGRDFDFPGLLDTLSTGSLFSTKEVYWLREPFFLAGNRGADEKRLLQKAAEGGFSGSNAMLLTWTGKLDPKQEWVKALQSKALVINLPGLDDKTIGQPQKDPAYPFLREYGKEKGKSLSNDTIGALRERLDNSLFALVNAVDQLIAAVGERTSITPDDVQTHIPRSRHDMMYTLTEDIAQGKVDHALQKLRQFFLRGESPVNIHAVLTSQVRGLFAARMLLAGPLKHQVNFGSYESFSKAIKEGAEGPFASAPAALTDAIGMKRHPFPVFKLFQQAESFANRKLLRTLHLLHEVDLKLKTTSVDGKLLLEELVIDFCISKV